MPAVDSPYLTSTQKLRLAALDGNPGWAVHGGYRPKGETRISRSTALALRQRGLAEERMLGAHRALVITAAGRAAIGRPLPDHELIDPERRWWVK